MPARVKGPTDHVVIVGAGYAGLSAALRLAGAGRKVTVIERESVPGGRSGLLKKDGYSFDTGPSLLTLPAVYKDFFQRTGKPMGLVCPIESVNPSFDYRFTDGSNVKFANLSRKETLDAITASFGADSASQWDRIMKRAEKMWDVSRGPFIESELTSPLSLLKRVSFLRDLRIIAPWRSLRGVIRLSSIRGERCQAVKSCCCYEV